MKLAKSAYGTGSAIAGFLLLFVALSSLVLGMVLTARRTNALLFQHELERAANGLVEDFAWNNRLEEDLIDGRIAGFGILRPNGAMIAAYGERPERFEVPPGIERGSVYVYDTERGMVNLYRGIGIMRPRMMPRMPPHAPDPGLELVLYLKWNATEYFREQRLYMGAAVTGPMLVGILTGLLFYLFIRNRHFRRKIADRERLAQLGESARTLMHEMKNPLNAINIRASLLEKTASGEIVEDAGAIRDEVERLRNLAEKIHTFLKDPAGTREKIRVMPLIREILEANRWNDVELSIERGGEEAAVVVFFDRQRFRSVIENLVTNAYESGTGPDTDNGSIEISIETRKRKVIVKVFDRGSGLPPEEKERLFDPFFTTKTSGSGIGLAVSRRFMQAAGGAIELHPRQGGGTAAVLIFPKGEV